MAEWCFALGNGGAFLHADLYGIFLTEKWQVEQAFLLCVVHVLENHIVVVLFLVERSSACSGPQPFSVLLYIQVISAGRESSGIDSIIQIGVIGLYGDY